MQACNYTETSSSKHLMHFLDRKHFHKYAHLFYHLNALHELFGVVFSFQINFLCKVFPFLIFFSLKVFSKGSFASIFEGLLRFPFLNFQRR